MMSGQTAAEEFRSENRLTAAYLIVAHVALFIGVVLGLFQALEYAGINLYPLVSPLIQSYYHGLSLHGVLNVLVWTTFFISGFLTFVTVRALGTPLQGKVLGWTAFAVMVAGLVITAVPLIGNQATVMFTFYPPMKAQGAFYLGLTLVVAATWLVALSLYRTYNVWRLKHPDEWTPLGAFMALITFTMWTIASWALPPKCCSCFCPGRLAGFKAPMRCWPAPSSGSPPIPSSTFGSYQRTFPGTRWSRNKREADSSATPWRAPRSSSF